MINMLQYPPPHYILFEPLNDKETQIAWKQYSQQHSNTCEFTEVDAAKINSVETFDPWFYTWITQVSARQSTRFRVLIIWHSEFLTFSCQQMLRRSLEERSFKCRVWFHVEDPTQLQLAIQSRCIIKRMPTYINTPIVEQL
jgi:DNA polymerase III delta prime subunit